MLTISNDTGMKAFLADPPDPELAVLVAAHAERLADFELEEIAIFAVCQPGDTLDELEQRLERPMLDATGNFILTPEYITEASGWYEVVFILSDDGFGLVLFVAKSAAMDPRLLKACANP